MIDKDTPNGLKSIGKIYVVEYDNGEPYEDGFHCVDGIFYSKEAAEKYLTNMGLIKTEPLHSNGTPSWIEPEYVCSMDNMYCENCPKFDDYECDEYELRQESEWDNSSYTIYEHDLLDIV